jgi:formate-dependent nitrite reductase cytochrome c552 subunit
LGDIYPFLRKINIITKCSGYGEDRMKGKFLKICMGIFVIAVIIVLFVMLGNNLSKGDTRAGETYVGSESCKTCHNNSAGDYIYYNWEQTIHGTDWANDWYYRGNQTNKYTFLGGSELTGMTGSCASCHVVGYNQTGSGGFDPAYPWNDTVNSENANLLRIGCENCHGPGSSHTGSPMSDNININIDPYTACGGTEYAGCHNENHQFGIQDVPGWNASEHAPWDDNPGGEVFMNTYCARCKSPSQWDPMATREDADNISVGEFRGITCADCHDPHNVTSFNAQLRWDPELICEVCHSDEHHETVRNSQFSNTPSVNVEDYPYMDNVTCIDCHMLDINSYTPDPYRLNGHFFEPQIAACINCHTDIYDRMPNGSSQSDMDNWTAELDSALINWSNGINTTKDAYYILEDEVDNLFHEVDLLKDIAINNGRWTPEMDTIYDQAEYDYLLAEHQSSGAHNPSYTFALLNASKANLTIIFDDLSMGLLKGEVYNASGPISNVNITVNGNSVMTDSNGNYTMMVTPDTYAVTAFKSGSVNETVTDFSIDEARVTWLNFSIDEDFDNDGIPDSIDDDDDNDTYLDDVDVFPLDPTEWEDTDSDGIGDNADFDDDNDGVPDIEDDFPKDPTEWKDTDSDGTGDNTDTDDDGDGVLDEVDVFPFDPFEWEDSDLDGTGDNADINDDNDGYVDTEDLFPKDPTEWADFDSDGIGDNADLDDDSDGVLDVNDSFPFDPTEYLDTDKDSIGDNSDLDDDGDGYLDENDEFPKDSTEWVDTDSDGTGNNEDLNDDDDGFPDFKDKFPLDPTEWGDNDGDGIGDNADPDDDNDGYQDDDDDYPLDSSRWLKEEEVKSDSSILFIVIVLVIIAAILGVLLFLSKMKGPPKKDVKTEEEELPPPPPPE